MVYTGFGATNAINNFQLESPRLIAVSLSGPQRFIVQTLVETTIAVALVPKSIDLSLLLRGKCQKTSNRAGIDTLHWFLNA